MLEGWPPAGFGKPPFEFASIQIALDMKGQLGYDWRNASNAERNLYFANARCSRGHTVAGVILIVDGIEYPFARCEAPPGEVKHFLVLWPPYEVPEP